jgi:hypothetical protein
MAVALESSTGTETQISIQHQPHGDKGKEMTADAEPAQEHQARSGVINVAIAGLALFSDGYNAQISKSCKTTAVITSNRNHRSWLYGASILCPVCLTQIGTI